MGTPNRVFTIDDYLKAPAHPLRQTGGRRSTIKRGSDPERPLVTVITIVLNRKETLPQTIMSVLSQSYPNIEYIVIDGGSTDGTLDAMDQFGEKIDLWISEPDRGTSDAFNKGLSLARGEFIFGLSSDDWIGADFIELAVKALLRTGADFVFGNMAMYTNGNLVSLIEPDKDYAKSLMSGNPRFNYPCMVIKREWFLNVGLIDMTYKIAGDYEWLLRFHQHGGKGHCEKLLTVHRTTGGTGGRRPGESYLFQSLSEQLRVLRQHGLPMSKAVATHLYYFLRRGPGHLAKLLLPDIIYKKLKRASSR